MSDSPYLTKREAEILTRMRDAPEGDDDGELVYDGGRTAWLGLDHVAPRTLFKLLRLCAISADQFNKGGGGAERFTINDTGRALLDGKPPPEFLGLAEDMLRRGYR
jgi:hypothetical protein